MSLSLIKIPSSSGGPGASFYQIVQDAGTPLTQRSVLNFASGFVVTDNSGNDSTDITVSGATTPGWNDTLVVDPVAVVPYQMLQTTTNPWYFATFRPDNYNPGLNQLEFGAWIIDVDYGDPSGRHNVVGSHWSYNFGAGGNLLQGGEGAFAFKTETNFFGNFEFHWPEIITSGGVNSRLWSFYGSKSTGSFEVQGTLSQITLWDPSDTSHVGTGYFTVQSQHGAPAGGKAIIALTPDPAFGQDTSEIRLYQDAASYVSVQNAGAGNGMYLNAFGALTLNNSITHIGSLWVVDQTLSVPALTFYCPPGGGSAGFLVKGSTDLMHLADDAAQFFSPGLSNTGYIYGASGLYAGVGVTSVGYIATPYKEITATYTVVDTDFYLNATSGTFTATLPLASLTVIATAGYSRDFWFKNTGAGVLTVAAHAGETINGLASVTVAPGVVLHIKSNGVTNWVSF